MLDAAYVAFEADRRIGSGSRREVARAAREVLDRHAEASILIFDCQTSTLVDFDLRGSVDDVLKRIPPDAAVATPEDPTDTAATAPRGPGRPKLGVYVPVDLIQTFNNFGERDFELVNQKLFGLSVTNENHFVVVFAGESDGQSPRHIHIHARVEPGCIRFPHSPIETVEWF